MDMTLKQAFEEGLAEESLSTPGATTGCFLKPKPETRNPDLKLTLARPRVRAHTHTGKELKECERRSGINSSVSKAELEVLEEVVGVGREGEGGGGKGKDEEGKGGKQGWKEERVGGEGDGGQGGEKGGERGEAGDEGLILGVKQVTCNQQASHLQAHCTLDLVRSCIRT
jgi:hypothetical protein